MSNLRVALFTVMLFVAAIGRVDAQTTPPETSATPLLTEDQKIEALIQAVRQLTEAKFVRNGTEYDGDSAANHMRNKWNLSKSKIQTARDFIKQAASESSVSGKPYLIRFADGREVTSAEYLTGVLVQIESVQTASNARTGTITATQPATGPATQPSSRPATTAPATTQEDDPNPAAPGFDEVGSEAKAIELADLTMKAMGGRRAWDQTRFVTWQYLGRRMQAWDRTTGDIRIEVGDPGAESHALILMNLKTQTGQVWKGGQEITDVSARNDFLTNALGIWTNDARWMFLPYQLKNAGVTLRYKGERKMMDGREADVVEAMMKNPGKNPPSRCEVYIAKDTHLVSQWSYFEDASELQPRITGPWSNWKRYGRIMLSNQRGPGRTHTDVAVFDELPDSVFKDPAPVDWVNMQAKALPVKDE